MDSDPPSESSRKVKFTPKGPPRGPVKSTTTTIEAVDEDDGSDVEAEQQALLRRVQVLARRGSKVEKKSSVQVVFSHGVASTTLRTFGKPRQTSNGKSEADDDEEVTLDKARISSTSPSTDRTEVEGSSSNSVDDVIKRKKREYMEPWDYEHSNYPVTLPLRRPYSGDPELLDEAEFEEDIEYDENALSSAKDLGLLDQDDTPKMLLFQLPANLPLDRVNTRTNRADTLKVLDKSVANQKEKLPSSFPSVPFSGAAKGKQIADTVPSGSSISAGAKGKGISGSSTNQGNGYDSRTKINLEELPEGYMGKMMVYKSGNVKLKLGDIQYDVSPGSECTFAQNVVAINTSNRHCCELGALTKRAVVSPDIDLLLDNVINLG